MSKSASYRPALTLGRLLALASLAAVLTLVWAARPVRAATECVSPGGAGGCFSSIQAAVNAASPGDTITVGPGTYNENVTIPAGKDNLTLRSSNGAAATTIVGSGANGPFPHEAVVDIEANGVTLGGLGSGFTIENGPSTPLSSGEELIGVQVGITNPVANVQVVGNVIQNILAPGSTFPAGTTFGRIDGIAVTNSTNTTVSDNTIGPITTAAAAGASNVFAYGVLFFGTNSNATVTGNSISGLAENGGACRGTGELAISINDTTTNATVSDNTIKNISSTCVASGISTSAAAGTVTITHNTISSVSSSSGMNAGIGLKPAGATVIVTYNELTQDGTGVAILSPLGPGSGINLNNFIGNPVAIANASGVTVDATNNYYGCSTGPNTDSCDTTTGPLITSPFSPTPIPGAGAPSANGVLGLSGFTAPAPQTAPTKTCTATAPAVGGTTTCTLTLTAPLGATSYLTDTLLSPAGATITSCTATGGLACQPATPSGGVQVNCPGPSACATGSTFSLVIGSSVAGALSELVTITPAGRLGQSFTVTPSPAVSFGGTGAVTTGATSAAPVAATGFCAMTTNGNGFCATAVTASPPVVVPASTSTTSTGSTSPVAPTSLAPGP